MMALAVAYINIGMAQMSLGRPCDDALETAAALEERLLQKEADEALCTEKAEDQLGEMMRNSSELKPANVFEMANVFAALGPGARPSSPGKKPDSNSESVGGLADSISNAKARFAIPQRGGGGLSVTRLSRMAPGVRGWTPDMVKTPDWRSPVRVSRDTTEEAIWDHEIGEPQNVAHGFGAMRTYPPMRAPNALCTDCSE